MIFGFNTDIKLDENTYHVQSEARVGEQVLQTQVFLQGRCIIKRAVSYAERADDPSFTEEVMHETLREQHRWVAEAIREGYVEEMTKGGEDLSKDDEQLVLRFVSSSRPSAEWIVLCFQLSLRGAPLSDVHVHAHIIPERAVGDAVMAGASASSITNSNGLAEIKLPMAPGVCGEANLVVQATHASYKTLKKFRLKAASAR